MLLPGPTKLPPGPLVPGGLKDGGINNGLLYLYSKMLLVSYKEMRSVILTGIKDRQLYLV